MLETLTAWLGTHGLLSILGALGVGIITAMAPCSIVTLPLLVGSAVALSGDLQSPGAKRRFVILFSLLFVLGLVLSFSILMLLTAKIGLLLSVAPLWADLLAALATFALAAYAMGWLGSGIDKQRLALRLLRFRLLGALILGMIFDLVSTPCASAPLVAIITVAKARVGCTPICWCSASPWGTPRSCWRQGSRWASPKRWRATASPAGSAVLSTAFSS